MVVEVGNYSAKALRRSIAVSIRCVYVWLTRKTCKDDCSCLKKKEQKQVESELVVLLCFSFICEVILSWGHVHIYRSTVHVNDGCIYKRVICCVEIWIPEVVAMSTLSWLKKRFPCFGFLSSTTKTFFRGKKWNAINNSPLPNTNMRANHNGILSTLLYATLLKKYVYKRLTTF